MASRNLSFASIAVLINGVIFGMFSYWASIFLLPKEVVDQVTNICCNYLWGGSDHYTKVPHVAWQQVCRTKTQGGLGLKDFDAWNKATIAKLV